MPIAVALLLMGTAEANAVTATANGAQTQLRGVGAFAGTLDVRGASRGSAVSHETGFAASRPMPGTPRPAGQSPRVPDPIPGTPGRSFRRGESLQPIAPGEAILPRPSESPGGNDHFLYNILREPRRHDRQLGLSGTFGHASTLSSLSADIISYDGTNRPDNGESHVDVNDIIRSDCFGGVSTSADESIVAAGDEGQPSFLQ